jgi:hemoglobin
MSDEAAIYSQLGPEGITDVVRRFYAQIPADPILAPMYEGDDLEGAEHRLRSFLMFRLGGPATYLEERGHPRLRMRHAPFVIDQAARDRWVQLMDRALDEAGLDPGATRALRDFLAHVATFLINRAPA